MKTAIGYIRISDKDQSNFSIEGQDGFIRDYCRKHDLELLATYTDDGRSAKNFDRPDWKKLEEFIKINHRNVDCLVMIKYDRFSRNTREALNKIEQIEERFKIMIISVFEQIGMHPKSPYYFQARTNMLVGAQVEWMQIRDRTKFGIHVANKNGRYVNAAPIGYKNARDEKDKPILIVDDIKSVYIKKIFSLFLAGNPVEQIRRELKLQGFKIAGNSTIQRVLTNSVYAGLIKVNAYYDEPESLQKGIHEPLIAESDWWKAQALIHGNKGKSHLTINENVPLRGALLCFCSKHLTAGNSKSKSGKYHWYYNCNNKDHQRFNYNAVRIHDQCDQMWKELSLPPHHIKYLENKAVSRIIETMSDQYGELKSNEQRMRSLILDMDSLEEKHIKRIYDDATYMKWKTRYMNDMETINKCVASLKEPLEARMQKAHDEFGNLRNLSFLFEKASVVEKHSWIKWVFDSKLYYEGNIYRTPYIKQIFSSKAALLKEKRLLIIEQPLPNSGLLNVGSPSGNLIEQLTPFLALLSQIKAA